MKPGVFIGALIGAALGALLWAGVAYMTGLEIGWIAWGVGGLIGLCAAIAGGQGGATGMLCAALAIAAIFAGKWLAVDMIAEQELRKMADMAATTDVYADVRMAAIAFADVDYEDEYAEFMVEYGYTDAEYEEDVLPFELAAFKSETATVLQDFHREKPTYEQWKQGIGDEIVKEWEAHGSVSEVVSENLSAIDILFFVLGVLTAYSVGSKGIATQGRIKYHPPARRPDTSDEDAFAPPDPQTSAFPPSTAPPVRDSEPALLQDEPPNPYAYPMPGQQTEETPEPPPQEPPPAAPSGPVTPRKIPRLGQPVGTPARPDDPAGEAPFEPSPPPRDSDR